MGEEPGTRRRLAAILAADVAGYSRLMGDDEEGTLAALKGHRRDLVDPLLAQHHGRVFKTMGDGILIEFGSVVDAVRCAVLVQQGMADRNADIEEKRRIRFRVGINVGDIIVDGDDIFGDGVNVAARLETLAEPGGICVSASVRDHVGARLSIAFADMGAHSVKNIARPVHVYRVETDAGAQPAESAAAKGHSPAVPDRPSIAVLPFTNMSGDEEQDYFADGMAEDIITGLARIKWLFVIARNSTFVYKGTAVDVKQVGRDLGVRHVLEGSVRKAANRVRVTGQLIEAETGRHVWADRYDRTLEDVFAIQDDLTMSVVAAIEPSLRQAEIERVKRKRPDSLDAYDLLLQALPHVYPAMPRAAQKALPLLERALDMQPDYALAHGFTAWSHEILFARGGRRAENSAAAIRHAEAAIAQGPDDAIALSLGGFVTGLVAHDRAAARQALDAALVLSPSCALAYNLGSVVLIFSGDAEHAIEWAEKALRLSPVDPMNYAPWFAISLARLKRGEHEESRMAASKAAQSNPLWSSAQVMLAASQARLQQDAAAQAAAARVIELEPGFTVGGLCESFEIDDSVAVPLRDALRLAGLPD